MHRGSCLCGSVAYEINGEIGPIFFCHCENCRKANGGAFNTAAPVAAADFTLVKGLDTLREYESSPGVFRVFCSGCGAPLYSRRDAMPDVVRLRLGTLETVPEGKPTAHIFVAEKAEWFEIADGLPQYEGRPE